MGEADEHRFVGTRRECHPTSQQLGVQAGVGLLVGRAGVVVVRRHPAWFRTPTAVQADEGADLADDRVEPSVRKDVIGSWLAMRPAASTLGTAMASVRR
ncbi:hypothetical protein [Candidatus Poriferisodalis sp.]|uniref:hypothetical protein n=1 Tax=Candidatus Poriferisodalis sp. TaxID=3101277 RepID=UPI003C6FCF7C